MVGVAVATMALVCTLSVFNGFQDLVADLFTSFDPQLKVTLREGKRMASDEEALQKLAQSPLVEVYTPVIEEQALIVKDGQEVVVTIKGVTDNYNRLTNIEDILYGEGEFCLHADILEYGVMGIHLASQLGLSTSFSDPIELYAPKRGERVNMSNPMSSFRKGELLSPGVVFMVRQSKYDANYILTSLPFAQKLFDMKNHISGVELKLKDGVSTEKGKKEISELLGTRFRVQDRYEQQDDVFRIMRIEKLISYLFLTFILLVACFNIIGSLSMLMIEKRADVRTLRSMGADRKLIEDIFSTEGNMISFMGSCIGILLGLLLCWAQKEFSIVGMGSVEGEFIIEAYPVSVHITDLLLILVTVFVVGRLSVWYPVRYLSKQLLA